MILPTKHISTKQSLIGLGAFLLSNLGTPKTITNLWEIARRCPEIGTFERFILTVDILYMIGAIEMREGILQRCES